MHKIKNIPCNTYSTFDYNFNGNDEINDNEEMIKKNEEQQQHSNGE